MDLFWGILKAFLVGGTICLLAQLLLNFTKMTMARILVLLVVVGAVVGAVGLYAPLAEFAGAGATVPLTGFGYGMIKGVRNAIDEQGAIGILTGPFSAAAAGTSAAVLCGLVAAFVAKPKER